MSLKLDAFKDFIEKHLRQRWDSQDERWSVRPGGGERYIQEKVLKKAAPCLTIESLKVNARENLLRALQGHVNLLSQFEGSFARVFIQRASQSMLQEKFMALLYDAAKPLDQRIAEFLDWAKIGKLPEEGKKLGINATVCSYFLAMSRPREYPYCKPIAYNTIVDALLSRSMRKDNPVDRIIHCQEIYKAILTILESEYGLVEGNLLDVHSLCYMFSVLTGEKSESELPFEEPNKAKRCWTYAPGRNAAFWEEFYEKGIMAIGSDFLGDLAAYETKEDILEKISENRSADHAPINVALACYDFSKTMQVGDAVFAKRGVKEIVGYGIVSSEYYFDANRESLQHVRKIKWLGKGSWTLPDEKMAVKTLTDITAYEDFVQRLWQIVGYAPMDAKSSVDSEASEMGWDYQSELPNLFIDDLVFWQIVHQLKQKKNIILQGPPGVGKTFLSRHVAWAIMERRDGKRLAMVQFHQSYSYEDFIQGFRPSEGGGFYLKNGIFHDFCKRASIDPENEYFFLIDEINRGNLGKIFGELMVLIEPDKRGTYALPLAYARSQEETFTVPPNLYLIGTMNTADRSLALVDYALRRRFRIIDIEPAFGNPKFTNTLEDRGIPEMLVTRINDRLRRLNSIIAQETKTLGPGFRIGHSYFYPDHDGSPHDEKWYSDIVDYEIAPLLREYWFDAPEKAQEYIEVLKA